MLEIGLVKGCEVASRLRGLDLSCGSIGVLFGLRLDRKQLL
jgi:hypothetical protein